MKRFQSKFSAIERIRQQKEKLAAAQIVVAQQALNNAGELLASSRAALNNSLSEIEETMRQSFAATNVKSGRQQISVQQLAINQRMLDVDRCQQQVDAAKQRRMTAFRDLRTVEEAAVRERAVYRKEQVAANLMIQMDNFRPDSKVIDSATQPTATAAEIQS